MAEMPVALYRASVSPGALVVLTRLWAYASTGTLWVHPSVRRLQDELGLANGTIYRRLAELAQSGLVARQWGESQGGRKVQGWTLRTEPSASHVSEVDSGATGETDSLVEEPPSPAGGMPATASEVPPVGNETSDERESRPPTNGNPLSTGSSHVKLPQEAPTDTHDDAFPPTMAELEAWQDPSRFALSSPEPTPKTPKLTAEQRRQERALVAWEANERHRRATWPRTTGRQVTESDLRAVASLQRHVRKRLGCDDAAAWAELERFSVGANEHAAAAERGETGDSAEWASKLVRWRNDGQEWGRKRYEAWVGEQAAGPRKARRRGHARAEDQDHTEERF